MLICVAFALIGGFEQFCREHEIYFLLDEYEMYAPVMTGADSYVNFCRFVMSLDFEQEELGEESEMLAMFAESFEQGYQLDNYSYYQGSDREENKQALETMKYGMDLVLKTYFGFSQEEITEFWSVSKSRKAVMLEERWKHGK